MAITSLCICACKCWLIIIKTRWWAFNGVKTHTNHLIAWNMFLHFVPLWPWPCSDLVNTKLCHWVISCVNYLHCLFYRAQEIFRSGLDSLRLRITVERTLESNATNHTPQTSAISGKFMLEWSSTVDCFIVCCLYMLGNVLLNAVLWYSLNH